MMSVSILLLWNLNSYINHSVRIAIDHVTWDAYTRHFKARAYMGDGRR